MPTIAELIAEIQSSDWERGKEIAAELGKNIKDLETATQRSKDDLKQQAETILAVVAAEGEGFDERLNDAAKKIAKLGQENQTLAEQYSQQTEELVAIKQNKLLSQAAEHSGVKTSVLKALLKEEDKLEVAGEKVLVNGVEIKDWAKTNQADFYVALFPKFHTDIDLPGGGSSASDLPAGGSGSTGSNSEKKPVELLMETDFKVPEFVTLIGGKS